MKIYVESVSKHISSSPVATPTWTSPDAFVAGKVGTAVEVRLHVVVDSPEEAAEWEAVVGKTLFIGGEV